MQCTICKKEVMGLVPLKMRPSKTRDIIDGKVNEEEACRLCFKTWLETGEFE